MNKKIIEYGVTAIAVVALSALLLKTFKKPGRKTPSEEGASSVQPSVEAWQAATDGETTKEADEAMLAQQVALAEERPWGRNPFYLVQTKKVYKGNALVFRGISVGKNKQPYVFINDQVLTLGDEISGYLIAEIQRDKILLKKGVDSFYLSLSED